jgi:hypothetical protein
MEAEACAGLEYHLYSQAFQIELRLARESSSFTCSSSLSDSGRYCGIEHVVWPSTPTTYSYMAVTVLRKHLSPQVGIAPGISIRPIPPVKRRSRPE